MQKRPPRVAVFNNQSHEKKLKQLSFVLTGNSKKI